MEWYLKVWQNYANFQGRARRKEYWMTFLFNYLIIITLMLFGFAMVSVMDPDVGSILLAVIFYAYFLAFLVPMLAVNVRRLHDTGRSGGWIFISLIPLIGPIVYLVFLCEDSHPDNQYGPNPKLILLRPAITS
jgi:uncharacterized membrane protein YhaH (DUF805 family)